MAQGDSLLILATDGLNTGVLFHDVEQEGNGRIEAGDLRTVATFIDGTPDTANIVVIGTAELN